MKNFQGIGPVVSRIILVVLFAATVAGCNLSDITGSNDPAGTDSSVPAPVNVSGSVGDGPVTGATVEVWSNDGQLLGSMTSDSDASFKSTLKVKGRDYPLLLKVQGGVDLVTGGAPDFQMLSVMQSPSDKQVNITPISTLIVLTAEQMPGGLINAGNVATAQQYVMDRLGFGLDTSLLGDPITGEVTDANVANLVKSSETCGEMVRRTRDLVTATGRYISGDEVLQALAADLVDGLVDGLGTSGVDTLISAVATVVSGQVLVEALSNNLKVGGVIATGVIDQAIMTTHPQVSTSQLTDGVRVTAGMLQQTLDALTAVEVIDNSAVVQGVVTAVGNVPVNALPEEVEPLLPADSSNLLDNALTETAYATPEEVYAINQALISGSASGDTGTSTGGSTDGGASSGTTLTNAAPVISGSPSLSVVAGTSYLFQPVASDADGDLLVYSVVNLPAWASFSTATGQLSGVPDVGDAGNYSNIVISVTDGTDSASLAAFGITVTVPVVQNTVPLISGVPATSVVANNGYQFQPSASDADGDNLSFSITGKPAWAGFEASSGRLSGTPADSDAGSYNNIVITVTDGKDSASLPAFSISVTVPVIVNSAPVIGGVPAASVTANSGYLFQPQASDADGDALSFSVSNLPPWANFDSSSGRLSGVPGDIDVGSYNNIVISVTDGKDTARLQSFGITVDPEPIQYGMFTLQWVAPTMRADGTPLAMSDIEGYHIYYGDHPGNYTNSMTIADGAAVSATVNNLPVGTYYLVMTTYDMNGLESSYSTEITKQVQ